MKVQAGKCWWALKLRSSSTFKETAASTPSAAFANAAGVE
jgi:hypothetical protein